MIHSLEAQTATGNQATVASLSSGIRVIAKAYGDSIVLRWAPAQAWAWHKLNILGYKIERIDLSEKNNPKREWLTASAIKPYSLEKFKTSFTAADNFAAIAAQCLYGNNFNTNIRKGQAAIEDQATVSAARYSYVLQAADFDARVATATALRFTDKQVKKGSAYIYRIVPAAKATQGTIDTGTVMIENILSAEKNVPEIAEALAFDRLAELHWQREGTQSWSGFFIERSSDGNNFIALNKLPFISSRPDTALTKKDSTTARFFALLQTRQVFIDSLPQNYHNYVYRIRGINAFAELSGYSAVVTVSGRDLTPPAAPDILTPRYISDRKINVQWSKTVKENDLKGFYVSRAHNINGPYETLNRELLPPSATTFVDNNAFAHGSNFYMVIAVDTASNISSSTPAMGLVPDSTAPAAPQGLAGHINKNGLVYLSWNANKEEDVKGYKVYYANQEDHVFTQITTEPDSTTAFVDSITLKTLTKNIWYKIVAVDYNNNHSAFSVPVRLRKPDIVAPVPPLPTSVKVDTGSVTIDFINSSSDDVRRYVVYRKEGSNAWKTIDSLQHNTAQKTFRVTDRNIQPFTTYQYCAEAIDEDSLHSSRSLIVQAVVRTVPEMPAISSLKVAYDAKSKTAQLNWQYQQTGDYFFIIYRGNNNGLIKYRSLPSGKTTWTDNLAALPAGSIQYAIQAVFKDGRKTSTDHTVTITVQ